MRHRHAFTLIELLVVVAIIVALLAILLPSMGRAVATATMAKCGAQQRQLGTALLTYAADNQRFAPLGYVSNNIKHGNYYLTHNGGPTCMLGVLYESGHVREPLLFYCPALESGDLWSAAKYTPAFDSGKLKWQNMAPDNAVRGTYLARPAVQWDDVTYMKIIPQTGDETQSMPRLLNFDLKAVVACSNYSLDPHLGGVVVTTGGGSTRVISPTARQPATGDTWTQLSATIRSVGHNSANNTNITRAWQLFDAR